MLLPYYLLLSLVIYLSFNICLPQVRQFERQLTNAPLVLVDGNLPQRTINYILDLCRAARVPGKYNALSVHCRNLDELLAMMCLL